MALKPLVSIIVPIYNMQDYLDACLKSLKNQTYTNLEIILVNDGSTDNSNTICEKYCQMDNRFLYFLQPNGGLSNARNNGIKKMTGDYAFFVDSDDWLELHTIEILVENALKYNEKVVQFTLKEETSSNAIELLNANEAAHFLLEINEFYAWNKLIHNTILNDVWFVEGQVFEDLLFTFKIIEKAKKILFIKKGAFYYYRVTPNSLSRSSFTLKYLDEVKAYEQTIALVESKFAAAITNEFKNRLAFLYVNNFINLANKYASLDPNWIYRNAIKMKLQKLKFYKPIKNAKLISQLPVQISSAYFKLRYKFGI